MKGDFLGFTFKTGDRTYTSKQLGFIRTSDGDRYNETIPEIEDKTVEIPGLDGAYFYGSNFKNRQFSIKIAFERMTEDQFRLFKQVFGYKHIGELIFDEAPYKKYLVKVASAPELEFVCFDEKKKTASETSVAAGLINNTRIPYTVIVHNEETDEDEEQTRYGLERSNIYPWVYSNKTERIYKGEGTIEFVAYYPFAKSVFKELGTENENADWAPGSKMVKSLSTPVLYDTLVLDEPVEGATANTGTMKVYNAGDVPTGFRLYVPFDNQSIQPFTLLYGSDALYVGLNGESISSKNIGETGIFINTTNGLIEGAIKEEDQITHEITFETTGSIYNEQSAGVFFKIKPSENNPAIPELADKIITSGLDTNIEIYYDYLYF